MAERVVGVTKLHSSFKVTISKELRDYLGVADGDYIKFVVVDESKVEVRRLEP